jgi:hypothetical protein
MAVLTAAKRKALPAKSFALPGKGEGPHGKGAGSYPIPDKAHGRAALSRVAQHGSSADKAKVRAAVHRKFPTIGRGEGARTNAADRPGAREHGRFDWVFSK